MNEEVKRFFKSIGFITESFLNTEIEKVILNKKTDSFEVFLKAKEVIAKEEIDKLLLCSKNGIENKVCEVRVHYLNITIKDIKNYLNIFLNDLIVKRPSFKPLNDYEMVINDNEIILNIKNKFIASELTKIEKNLQAYLKNYFLGKYTIKFIVEDVKKSLTEGILENNNILLEAKDETLVLGIHKEGKVTSINNLFGEVRNVILEAYVFSIEAVERKGQKATAYILNLKISDKTDSFLVKMVRFEENVFYKVVKKIKKGDWYRFHGNIELDQYLKQLVLNVSNIETIPSKDIKVKDDAEVKRVELHAHTMMSVMDGVISTENLIKFASSLGHKAVAITDHNVLQAFPDAYNAVKKIGKDFKVLYGVEMNVVDTESKIVYNPKNYLFKDQEFVVYDTETTGLAPGKDQMIEIGAIKVKNNEIIARFDELIAYDGKLPDIIISITNITDDMLVGKDNEENVTRRFLEFVGDLPLVAHNAAFDNAFIENVCSKYNLKEFKNTVIDTMALARTMYPDWRNHKLSTLVKNLNVEWDEEKHHRADYDSEGTSSCFYKMVTFLQNQNIEDINGLDSLINHDNIVKFARPFHLCLLVKNSVGLKNLFKIVSIANTKYLFKGKEPKIPRNELIELKEGLFIGSGCLNGEIFSEGLKKDDDELRNMMAFYDYIEVYPLNVVSHLIGKEGLFHDEIEYYGYIKRLINVAKTANKLVVATGDVHNLRPDDLIYRKIIVNQKTNGRYHPLNRKGMEIPNQYFLTTDEMLLAFSFLDEEIRKEIVIENPNKIADMIENLQIIRDDLYTPIMENSAEITKVTVYEKAREIYGKKLPEIIEKRIEAELAGIIGGGFDVIYLIAEKLVKQSNKDGYFVGSRGSVGSSLVATMMGITEVNGLKAHYVCPNCKKTIFEIDGRPLALDYISGYDMPDLECVCKTLMKKEGQDMPFATFLGFKAEKVPDIDLNFSGDYQAEAHNYVKKLFGEANAYRAGTISTVADKTAYGYVKGYCEDKGIILNPPEIERLAQGCIGVKKTTGQHPGGIIVIPDYMNVFDFTAYQYPADEPDSSWFTTHFDFHAIHDNVLKLDILGHDDPTMLRYLGDTTKINILDIKFDDPKVLSMFNSCEILGVKEPDIMCATGTLGIPEFGTNFVIRMLLEIKPTKFSDLVKIAGLSHGTNVWQNNVRDIIVNEIATFKEVVGCRDDIMVSLINYGMEPSEAFKISEFVRKGKAKFEPEKWGEMAATMYSNNVPEWFIECCRKIEYMFPKAHACAYVMMAYRVAWFKLYYPLYYYSAFFSIRRSDFDVFAMLKGQEGIRQKIVEIKEKGYSATAKEQAVLDTLNVALEMLVRGYEFKNINIEKSMAKIFVIDEVNKSLIIPFMAVEGLGESVANKIEEERNKKPFYCIEDFAERSRVNQTTVGKLKDLGVFEGMAESAQMSLF